MKKLINDPVHVVDEMLEGLVAVYPAMARLSGRNVLVRADVTEVRDKQATLVSGGGSGHEPAHAGYIGSGMLTAAVAGEVFTSPPAAAVFAAIKAVAGRPGVLLIIKNYTGDRLNFAIAAEMARAEGISVETVVVADDVALVATQDRAMRRGLAGTVLVHKIAGAAAAAGKDLGALAVLAQAVADEIVTFGLSLSAGTVPAVGKPSYSLNDDEIELGLGIHGEPGVRRTKLQPADQLAAEVVDGLLGARAFNDKQRIVVMINNLGATTPMELAIFGRSALDLLRARGLIIERVYSGTFMSSLEAAGVSLSLLPVDDERLRFLDAPTSAPGWPNVSAIPLGLPKDRILPDSTAIVTSQGEATRPSFLKDAVKAACEAMVAAEHQLTELDQKVGDGDLGSNLARGARAVLNELPRYPPTEVAELLRRIGVTLQDVVGGSSGPLYGVLLLRAGNALKSTAASDLARWADAIAQSCQALSTLGGARRGDRTMLDALIPFSETFTIYAREGKPVTATLQAAVQAADAGAAATAQMAPHKGRSSYLGERAIGQPDPGAVAVTIWLRALSGIILEKIRTP